MKKIFNLLMVCLFLPSFLMAQEKTQEKLQSFLPLKKGLENYTVPDFVEEWNKKTEEEVVYFLGGHFLWSARNTQIAPGRTVFDLLSESGYEFVFRDKPTLITLAGFLWSAVVPLEGKVKTAGISGKTKIVKFEREAYDDELPFMFDWNVLEEEKLFEVSFGGVDLEPMKMFSAKCGNPIYSPRLGGGYYPKPKAAVASHNIPNPMPGSEASLKPAEVKSGDTYMENNYYYPERSQEHQYYSEPRIRFTVGILFGSNDGCWGHNSGYCYHGVPFRQFGYQPVYGPPQITNQNVYVNVVNNNTNINNPPLPSPPNPPTTGSPVNPPNGPYPTWEEPVDPSGRTGRRNSVSANSSYVNLGTARTASYGNFQSYRPPSSYSGRRR